MLVSLLIIIVVSTVISLAFIFIQNKKFVNINEKAGAELSEFSDTVLNDNIRQYVGDITTACGNIIDKNYDTNKKIGDSVAAYAKGLYSESNQGVRDSSYGVGFIGGKNSEKLAEFNKIGNIREYITSIPDYDAKKLDTLDVFVVTKSGIVLDGTKDNLGDDYRDLRKDSWYIDGYKAKRPVWTDVIVGSVTGEKKIDYVVPIIVNGDFKGVSVVSAPITEIYNNLLNINFKGIKDIILTDSKGERVAGSDKYNIKDIKNTEDIVFYDNYCISSYKVHGAEGTVYFVFDVEKVLSVISMVESEIENSGNTIKAFSAKFAAITVVLYGVFTLILIGFALVYSKKISTNLVSPILKLTKKVESFGKGDMIVDFDDINSDDEVGTLAEKFSIMSKELNEYLDEVTEIAAEKERFKTEMEAAANIQLSLMSSIFPKSDKYDVFAFMKPAKSVGGDLYAMFKIDEDNVLVSVADVAGKGIPASLFSVRTKVYIQIYGEMGLKPSEILAKVNNRLCQNNQESVFVTAFLGILNIKTGNFTYSNAGHNKPVVMGETSTEWLNTKAGLPLGCMEDMVYTDSKITLNKNEGVFIYSDGVTEAVGADDSFFGDDRLINRLSNKELKAQNGKYIINTIIKDLEIHYNGRELWDDITMLYIKYTNSDKVYSEDSLAVRYYADEGKESYII